MTFLAMLIFGGSLSAALYAIGATVAPLLERIAEALACEPLSAGFGEREIAVMQRKAARAPAYSPAAA